MEHKPELCVTKHSYDSMANNVNPLSANPTKLTNTLKQFVGNSLKGLKC